jgi:hypothetical protein
MAMSCPCLADFKVTKVGDSVVDPTALTLDRKRMHSSYYSTCVNVVHCQQDAVVTHGKHQYVGYYDANRRVCLARRKLPEGQWSIIRFADYVFKTNDDHNTICIGVCPKDGTIHLAFDHHLSTLNYRVSRKGIATHPESVKWEASLFGPIISELEKGKPLTKLTYPRFWQTPDGGLQINYRVHQGKLNVANFMLADYDADTGTWINTRQITSGKGQFRGQHWSSRQSKSTISTSRCGYPNSYTYGPLGRLHVTWLWSDKQGTHDIMYAYSEDRGKTWLNNQEEALTAPIHIGSPGVKVVDISPHHSLINAQGQAVDSQGRIHVVMWHTTDETLKAAKTKLEKHMEIWGPPDARRYHHYWRSKNGTWQHTELPWVSGTIPKLFMDEDDNAYLIYGGARQGTLMKIHNVDHNCTIAAATANSNWTDWKIIHVEKGPFFSDMLGDLYRWKKEGVLSVIVQESPKANAAPAALRVLDFSLAHE